MSMLKLTLAKRFLFAKSVAMIVGNALVPSLIAIIVIEKRIHPIPVN